MLLGVLIGAGRGNVMADSLFVPCAKRRITPSASIAMKEMSQSEFHSHKLLCKADLIDVLLSLLIALMRSLTVLNLSSQRFSPL